MKPWLSWDQQVSLLQERGLVVHDAAACEKYLSAVNYYRFMGYARYFQRAPTPATTVSSQVRRSSRCWNCTRPTTICAASW